MFAPIRPSPIIPSCIFDVLRGGSPNDEGEWYDSVRVAPSDRYAALSLSSDQRVGACPIPIGGIA